METTAEILTSNFRLVAIDESHHWKKDILDKCGGTIKTVYIYDKSVTTNLCEITPSYELTPLYYITESDVDDEVHELLNNEIGNDDVRYYHCHVVDAIESVAIENDIEFSTSESEEYKEHFSELEEYCNGNHLI